MLLCVGPNKCGRNFKGAIDYFSNTIWEVQIPQDVNGSSLSYHVYQYKVDSYLENIRNCVAKVVFV